MVPGKTVERSRTGVEVRRAGGKTGEKVGNGGVEQRVSRRSRQLGAMGKQKFIMGRKESSSNSGTFGEKEFTPQMALTLGTSPPQAKKGKTGTQQMTTKRDHIHSKLCAKQVKFFSIIQT